MKGLDTNVLVRFIVKDDHRQGAKAAEFLRQTDETFFINSIVLCEFVWVLETAYGYSRATIVQALTLILFTNQFEIEERDLALNALEDYRTSKGDFADCLIGRRNRASGCDKTATFDRKLRGLETFELLQ